MHKILKNKNYLSLSITLFIFILVLFFIYINIFLVSNKKIQNIYYYLNDTLVTQNNILVVEIDEDTLSGKKDNNWNVIKNGLGRFPFDRSYYSTVIDNLNNAWAWVIALDIIFWEESNKESDDKLSNSIKNAWNIVLCMWNDGNWNMLRPYYKFADYTLLNWYCRTNVDKINNITYSIYPFINISWNYYEHFTTSILRSYYSYFYNDKSYLIKSFQEDSLFLKIWDKIEYLKSWKNDNSILISYKNSSNYNSISFLDIYNNSFNPDLVKDKIIVIWATAKWIKDIFYTPLWIEYWVYTHVNFLNTIISKSWIKYLDLNKEYLIIICLIFISVYFNLSKNSYIIIFSNLWLFLILFLLILYFIKSNILLNYPIEIILSFILSITFSNIVKYIIENINKNKLNKALSEYVSKDIAEEIMFNSWKVKLDWERRKLAIYFSDIEGFTSISEKFKPEDLVFFLREYLSWMSHIIMDEKWFIDKYEWDAIMALWWTFTDYNKDWYNACKTALLQQKLLIEMNNKWSSQGFNTIKARIWLHIWEAIVWNIWADGRKMEFTALWDNVNLASRLEWVNKQYGTYICVSEDVYNENKDDFVFRYLDKIKVKWKDNSVSIYELVCLKEDLTEEINSNIKNFEKWIELYNSMNFKEAKEIFDKLISLWDNPSKTFFYRCEYFLNNPINPDWDGIYTMKEK